MKIQAGTALPFLILALTTALYIQLLVVTEVEGQNIRSGSSKDSLIFEPNRKRSEVSLKRDWNALVKTEHPPRALQESKQNFTLPNCTAYNDDCIPCAEAGCVYCSQNETSKPWGWYNQTLINTTYNQGTWVNASCINGSFVTECLNGTIINGTVCVNGTWNTSCINGTFQAGFFNNSGYVNTTYYKRYFGLPLGYVHPTLQTTCVSPFLNETCPVNQSVVARCPGLPPLCSWFNGNCTSTRRFSHLVGTGYTNMYYHQQGCLQWSHCSFCTGENGTNRCIEKAESCPVETLGANPIRYNETCPPKDCHVHDDNCTMCQATPGCHFCRNMNDTRQTSCQNSNLTCEYPTLHQTFCTPPACSIFGTNCTSCLNGGCTFCTPTHTNGTNSTTCVDSRPGVPESTCPLYTEPTYYCPNISCETYRHCNNCIADPLCGYCWTDSQCTSGIVSGPSSKMISTITTVTNATTNTTTTKTLTYSQNRTCQTWLYYTCSVPPQVKPLEIRFDETATKLYITFDRDTDMAGFTGLFNCSMLIDDSYKNMSILNGASCLFENAQRLSILLADGSNVVPGWAVSVRKGVLRASPQYSDETANLGLTKSPDHWPPNMGPVKLTILAPEPTLIPKSLIEGPTFISYCSDIILDGSSSYGGGNRGLLFLWTVQTTLNPPTNASVVNNIVKEINAPRIVIPSEYTKGGERWVFRLQVQNFLGEWSSVIPPPFGEGTQTVIITSSSSFPFATIVGGITQTVFFSQPYVARAEAFLPSCSVDKNMTFLWSHVTGKGPVNLDPIGKKTRELVIAPMSLPVSIHQLGFTATVPSTGLSGVVSLILYVIESPLQAHIRGGSRRLTRHEEFALDGRMSFDPDDILRNSSLLTYKWFCYVVRTIDNVIAPGERCPDFLAQTIPIPIKVQKFNVTIETKYNVTTENITKLENVTYIVQNTTSVLNTTSGLYYNVTVNVTKTVEKNITYYNVTIVTPYNVTHNDSYFVDRIWDYRPDWPWNSVLHFKNDTYFPEGSYEVTLSVSKGTRPTVNTSVILEFVNQTVPSGEIMRVFPKDSLPYGLVPYGQSVRLELIVTKPTNPTCFSITWAEVNSRINLTDPKSLDSAVNDFTLVIKPSAMLPGVVYNIRAILVVSSSSIDCRNPNGNAFSSWGYAQIQFTTTRRPEGGVITTSTTYNPTTNNGNDILSVSTTTINTRNWISPNSDASATRTFQATSRLAYQTAYVIPEDLYGLNFGDSSVPGTKLPGDIDISELKGIIKGKIVFASPPADRTYWNYPLALVNGSIDLNSQVANLGTNSDLVNISSITIVSDIWGTHSAMVKNISVSVIQPQTDLTGGGGMGTQAVSAKKALSVVFDSITSTINEAMGISDFKKVLDWAMFGSIILNGVKLEDSTKQVTKSMSPRTPNQMVVAAHRSQLVDIIHTIISNTSIIDIQTGELERFANIMGLLTGTNALYSDSQIKIAELMSQITKGLTTQSNYLPGIEGELLVPISNSIRISDLGGPSRGAVSKEDVDSQSVVQKSMIGSLISSALESLSVSLAKHQACGQNGKEYTSDYATVHGRRQYSDRLNNSFVELPSLNNRSPSTVRFPSRLWYFRPMEKCANVTIYEVGFNSRSYSPLSRNQLYSPLLSVRIEGSKVELPSYPGQDPLLHEKSTFTYEIPIARLPNETQLAQCVFWDADLHEWSLQGMFTYGITYNKTTVRCGASHLTEFSVRFANLLFRDKDSSNPMEMGMSFNMAALVVASIAIIGVATAGGFIFFGRRRRNRYRYEIAHGGTKWEW